MSSQPKSRFFDHKLPGSFSAPFIEDLERTLASLDGGDDFKVAYLRSELLSKFLDESKVPAAERRQAAIQKWIKAELRNSRTNERLLIGDEDLGFINSDDLILRVRRKIAWLLGPLDYPDILSGASFTNGATVRIKRSPIAAAQKLTGEVQMSSSCIKHWVQFAKGTPLSALPISVQDESVLFTVPKKSDIDRCACKEPEGNALLQRSVGLALRKRLLKVGINLHDQGRNQRLASRAYSLGLATIDLSSASDTISRQLVYNLLPFDWWSLLDDLRVHSTVVDGETHLLEMFSSMGNGFTFELETVIFWAVTSVVAQLCGHRKSIVSVYGDDIICRADITPRLMRVLSWLGFIPNTKKTHYKGPFRESCGRHYWRDFDVSPFYVRKAVSTLQELMNVLNRLLEWDGRGWGGFLSEELALFWSRWVVHVPKRFWGGISPEDPSALVTGHRPRKRLVPVLKAMNRPEEGSYLLWLLTKESLGGDSDVVAEVDPRIVLGFRAQRVIHCGERTAWDPLGYYRNGNQDEEAGHLPV